MLFNRIQGNPFSTPIDRHIPIWSLKQGNIISDGISQRGHVVLFVIFQKFWTDLHETWWTCWTWSWEEPIKLVVVVIWTNLFGNKNKQTVNRTITNHAYIPQGDLLIDVICTSSTCFYKLMTCIELLKSLYFNLLYSVCMLHVINLVVQLFCCLSLTV